MLERERDGTRAFRKVDMCKWQMGDPETDEVLVIGLHMVGKDRVWTCLQSSKN
jgi:hypothetical protein